MYLKSLKMQGFKSFPDPTLIEFHEGITAIVGPNGSGKSNITDAIRWVLGEQSAKTLRGSRMEDVIFSGTETRRQLGFAEVTITFDNSDQNIPIEYETVEVTRRYYRSGDSEYYINKTACRLKDIRELFLDTGIGRDGYSIIGQGRIDQILSDNSDDRRKVFDEAAGIVKYKLRKKETERKLERTEQNLTRINDILAELDLQIKPLASQAKKLKKYHNLRGEMEALDIGLILHDVKLNTSDLEKVDTNYDELFLDLEEAKKQAATFKSQFHEYENILEENDQRIDQLRLSQTEKQATIAELNEQYVVLKERHRLLELQNNKDKKQLDELSGTINFLDRDFHNKTEDNVKLETEILQLEADFQSETDKLTELNAQIEAYNNTILTLQNELEAKHKIISERDKDKSQFEQELHFVTEQISDLDKQISLSKKQHQKLITQVEDSKKNLQLEQEKFQDSSTDLQAAREKVESIRNELEKFDAEYRDVITLLDSTKFRLATLQELEQNLEGFHQTVKNVMQQVEADKEFAKGVHGPLGSLIRVPEKYEKSIEIALGAAINNIVVTTKEDASKIIEWLKKTKSGRETFLPLDSIRGRKMAVKDKERLAKFDGYLGIASEKVTFDPQYEYIIDRLLGLVIVAEDLDSALLISRETNQRYRIVTLTGDVVQIGGSMTGGEFKKGSTSGLLKRNRQIEALQAKVELLETESQNKKEKINRKNKSFMKSGQVQQDLEQKYLEQEKHIFFLESQVEQFNNQLKASEVEITTTKSDQTKYKTRKNNIEIHLSDLDLTTTDTQTEIETLEKNLRKQKEEKEKLDLKLVSQQEKVMSSNISLRTKEETLKNFLQTREQAKKDIEDQKNRYNELTKEIQATDKTLIDLTAKEASYQEEHQVLEKEMILIKENIDSMQKERSSNEKEQRQLFVKSEQQAELVSNINLQLERLKNRKEKLEENIQFSKNYIWENYEKTYVSLKPEDYPLADIKESREKLKQLKKSIKNLGNINPNAIDEFEEISERFDFVTMQKEDIEKSINNLEDVIQELEKAMAEQFKENFAQININFKEVFSALFVGGEAELSLEETEDTLNSGIEIKAQPPGKRLQNLNLLSGGERSLTAIALLLAIFKLRPAPFCVLDEVESSLDETNIIRFTDYLNSYTQESQFMLVTHRKGTMEAADRLYGITMKERGVSKVLSLELSDAEDVT
ncbi:MAG: chromosome segregation protein SMC [Clostridiaceae bacterium]|nr:chromosome segregation protein SMC [Clostridiaceae bacterium]